MEDPRTFRPAGRRGAIAVVVTVGGSPTGGGLSGGIPPFRLGHETDEVDEPRGPPRSVTAGAPPFPSSVPCRTAPGFRSRRPRPAPTARPRIRNQRSRASGAASQRVAAGRCVDFVDFIPHRGGSGSASRPRRPLQPARTPGDAAARLFRPSMRRSGPARTINSLGLRKSGGFRVEGRPGRRAQGSEGSCGVRRAACRDRARPARFVPPGETKSTNPRAVASAMAWSGSATSSLSSASYPATRGGVTCSLLWPRRSGGRSAVFLPRFPAGPGRTSVRPMPARNGRANAATRDRRLDRGFRPGRASVAGVHDARLFRLSPLRPVRRALLAPGVRRGRSPDRQGRWGDGRKSRASCGCALRREAPAGEDEGREMNLGADAGAWPDAGTRR